MERGVYAPSFETLEKITTALSVPAKELFTFDNKTLSPQNTEHLSKENE